MTDFTASNGIKVENFTHFSGLHRIIVEKNAKREIDVAVTADIVKALVEALDHERDEELGRWRWPENPDYVVYPKKESESAPQSGVRVVRESSGRSRDIERHVVDACEATVSVFGQAARAYFEAHPERKPWHEAQPGEVWALTVDGREDAYVDRIGEFHPIRPSVVISIAHDYSRITEGRRIWPEDAS